MYLLIFIIIGFVALICGVFLSFHLDIVFDKGLTVKETVSKINELSASEDGKSTLKFLAKQFNKMGLFKDGGKLNYLLYLKTGGPVKKCEDGIRRHILNTADLKLKGIHNFQNVCTALALTETLVDIDNAVDTIKAFSGVSHRLELVRTIDGVEWYNDSASTSPTRGISALNSFCISSNSSSL